MNEERRKKIDDPQDSTYFLSLQPSKPSTTSPSIETDTAKIRVRIALLLRHCVMSYCASATLNAYLEPPLPCFLLPNRKCGCALKSCSRTRRLSGRRNTELHGRSSPACKRGKHFIVVARLRRIAIGRCKVSPRKGKIIVAYSNPTSVPRLIERLLVFLGSTIYLSFETLKSSVLFDIFEKVETMEVSSVIFEKRKEREKKTDPRGKISHRIESRSGTFDRFPWK